MGSRSASGTGRGSLKDITNAMQAATPVETTTPTVDAAKDAKESRPLSMMARALSSGPTQLTAPVYSETVTKDAKAGMAETKTAKRASKEQSNSTLTPGPARFLPRLSIARLWVTIASDDTLGAKA